LNWPARLSAKKFFDAEEYLYCISDSFDRSGGADRNKLEMKWLKNCA
jgi:hypothetical protein